MFARLYEVIECYDKLFHRLTTLLSLPVELRLLKGNVPPDLEKGTWLELGQTSRDPRRRSSWMLGFLPHPVSCSRTGC